MKLPFAALVMRAGALLAFVAVLLGAFGAHVLEGRVTPERLEVWHTAVFYHMIHALGLLAYGLFLDRLPSIQTWDRCVGVAFIAAVGIFSGSLYALVLTGDGRFGAVTPVGGLLFLVAWAGWMRILFRRD